MRPPLQVRALSSEERSALEELYRHRKLPRMRTRAQIILLSAEQELRAHQIGSIVRLDEQTVRRWIERFNAEGLSGLEDRPHPGRESKVTVAWRDRLLEVVRK